MPIAPDDAPFSFPEKPLLDGPAPTGYRLTVADRVIGHGIRDFEAAVTAVLTWKTHSGSGFIPVRVPAAVALGAVSVWRIPFGPIRPAVSCRVFEVVDEPSRGGFGHGSLVGHPQQGWESYVVHLERSGAVRLRIRVTAKPAARWMAAAGPLGQVALQILLRRNLRSLDDSVRKARRQRSS